MTFQDELDQMRKVLTARGTDDSHIVLLELSIKYFHEEFVQNCINDVEKRVKECLITKEKLSSLEQLGLMVLRDSAYLPHEKV